MRYIQQGVLTNKEDREKIPPCSTLRSCRTKHADDCRCHNRIRQRHPLSFFFTLPTPHHEARLLLRIYIRKYIRQTTSGTETAAIGTGEPLYQADWLLRFYQFRVDELVDEASPDLDLEVDPKLAWALKHPEIFFL